MRRFVLCMVCFVISTSAGYAQSLGEVAKEERERRKKNEEPVRVIDETGLRQARGDGAIIESSVTTSAEEDDEASKSSTPDDRFLGPSSSRSASRGNCDSIQSSLQAAERRYNESITVTYKVPGRKAYGVRSGYNSDGSVIYRDIQNYETRTKKVSCSSAEGSKESGCRSQKQEIESIRAELRKCR